LYTITIRYYILTNLNFCWSHQVFPPLLWCRYKPKIRNGERSRTIYVSWVNPDISNLCLSKYEIWQILDLVYRLRKCVIWDKLILPAAMP
jgi:hypothetical protein